MFKVNLKNIFLFFTNEAAALGKHFNCFVHALMLFLFVFRYIFDNFMLTDLTMLCLFLYLTYFSLQKRYPKSVRTVSLDVHIDVRSYI